MSGQWSADDEERGCEREMAHADGEVGVSGNLSRTS